MADKAKYEVAIFELIPASKNGAGFVREDTVNTADPITLIHPKNRVIMSNSVVRQKSKLSEAFVNVPTRYIYNQEVILKEEQEKLNINPNPKTDKIVFKNGLLTVPEDGAFVGLFRMLKKHAQNLSNPDAPKGADGGFLFQPIFKEINPAKDAHRNNFDEFMTVEAIGYIKALVTEKGDKYVYNEERIDALCALFNVYSESYEQKTTALIGYAKVDPQGFLDKAKKSEQTINIEVNHGLKLKVIAFEGNSAVYVGKQVKIKTFTGQLSDEKKISALVNYFSSIDGKEAYELFKAELGAAKTANLSQQ